MRILGVDPGSRITGYGFIDYKDRRINVLEAGVISPSGKALLHIRINKIFISLGQLIDEYHPEVLVLGKLYAHQRHPATASIIGHARGVICLLCAQKNIELVEHSVKRIRKAVTGNGNATKVQTRRMICQAFNIDENKLGLDASDALALAVGFTHLHGRGI